MAKKARYEAQQAKKKNANRDGVIVGVEAYTHSNTPLEQFRSPFYMEKEKLRQIREEARSIRPRKAPPGSGNPE